jgi:ubiquinone/menaquinone biosynthesis C-methylase UbiE
MERIMDKRSPDRAFRTFASRASEYDRETNWVASQALLMPLVPNKTGLTEAKVADFLDVCSGTGQVAKLAAEKGWRPVALDQSREMLNKVSNDDILCVVGNAETLPFVDNAFEVVAMRQALHYFETEKMLMEMARVAHGEIRLGHITTHGDEDVLLWENYFRVASPGRVRVFTPNSISSAAKAVGLEVLDLSIEISFENFFGPIHHLGDETKYRLLDEFLSGPPKIVEQYFNKESLDESKPEMRLRWEFVTIKV